MPITRASDIGNYLYCRRAWWYRKQGYESANATELRAGTQSHERHGRRVLAAALMRLLGVILLVLSLILLISQLVTNAS